MYKIRFYDDEPRNRDAIESEIDNESRHRKN